MRSSAAKGEGVSPNQAEKQRQIVDAAKVVLARDSLSKCTARAIADASPLTKSAVHYYFADIDEIIDRAMISHVEAFTERVRVAGARDGTPAERLWAAAGEYLAVLGEVPAGLVLWYEYWVDSVRRDRPGPMRDMLTGVTEIFCDLLTDAGADRPERRGHALTSFLVGTATQQAIDPRPLADIRAEFAFISGLGL